MRCWSCNARPVLCWIVNTETNLCLEVGNIRRCLCRCSVCIRASFGVEAHSQNDKLPVGLIRRMPSCTYLRCILPVHIDSCICRRMDCLRCTMNLRAVWWNPYLFSFLRRTNVVSVSFQLEKIDDTYLVVCLFLLYSHRWFYSRATVISRVLNFCSVYFDINHRRAETGLSLLRKLNILYCVTIKRGVE